MSDDTIGGSGAANTPPFPRPGRTPPEPPPGALHPDDARVAEEPLAREDARQADATMEGSAGPDSTDPDARPAEGQDRSRRRNPTPPAGFFGRAGDEVVRRVERTLYHGLAHLADQFEDAAHRVEHLADARLHALGPRAERAAGAASTAATWLTDTADYLRSSDLQVLQRDLERQVREKPLQTLLVSAGAGWLLGKIVR